MKSKIFTLILICMALFSSNIMAQPEINTWYLDGDEENNAEFYQEKNYVNEGTYSLRTDLIIGVPYIYSGEFDVTAGFAYTFSIDILDNVAAHYKIYCEFLDASDGEIYGEAPVETTDNADWQTITWSATVPSEAVKAYVWIKIYDDDGFESPASLYLDNASFIMDGGSNLIPNGNFEEWTAPEIPEGSVVANWTESLYTPTLTSTIVPEQTNVSEGHTSVKYTFTDNTTPYFISDTFAVVADANFTFDFDFYVPDDKSEITTRIFFFDNAGTEIEKLTSSGLTNNPSWQTITQTGTVPTEATKGFVVIRILDGAGWDGSATFYADNAIYSEGGSTINKIVNGGFEYWIGEPASDEKDILSFKFAALDPVVTASLNYADFTITAEVPYDTDVTSLVPTIEISEGATVSPASAVAQDFTSAVTYTVTAEDESTQDWVVTITKAAEGQTVLFFEDFEDIQLIPSEWTLINNDGYTQAEGEERWQDSAWVVTTTGRDEFIGTQVAMASSYTDDMPNDGRADDWMILPTITIQDNSTLSWEAMSTTTSGNYPDDYMVVIAPAISGADPTIAYFESDGIILKEVEPESWSAAVSNPGNGKASHSVNLKDKGYADQDVWIAFVLTTDLYTNPTSGEPNSSPGGSNLVVDNIKVVNDVSSTSIGIVNKNDFDVNIYPNPSNGAFKLVLESENHSVANIEVIDMIGRVIYSQQSELNSGKNYIDVNVHDLKTGLYLISTDINNKVNVSKLMVK